eukprot:1110804-Prymnesium_polylepis.1
MWQRTPLKSADPIRGMRNPLTCSCDVRVAITSGAPSSSPCPAAPCERTAPCPCRAPPACCPPSRHLPRPPRRPPAEPPARAPPRPPC